MQQPPGYHASNSSGLVCRLRKTLYGLKQSGRRWYQKLVEIMLTHLGFHCCDVDQAVFFRRNAQMVIVVLVHVDDCTVAATNIKLVTDFKVRIAKHVEITDLGELHWLLGIEIKRDRNKKTIHLSQRSYIDSILRRYNFQDLKPVSIPMDTNIRLTTSPPQLSKSPKCETSPITKQLALSCTQHSVLAPTLPLPYKLCPGSR